LTFFFDLFCRIGGSIGNTLQYLSSIVHRCVFLGAWCDTHKSVLTLSKLFLRSYRDYLRNAVWAGVMFHSVWVHSIKCFCVCLAYSTPRPQVLMMLL
jgi:hypothetical protein